MHGIIPDLILSHAGILIPPTHLSHTWPMHQRNDSTGGAKAPSNQCSVSPIFIQWPTAAKLLPPLQKVCHLFICVYFCRDTLLNGQPLAQELKVETSCPSWAQASSLTVDLNISRMTGPVMKLWIFQSFTDTNCLVPPAYSTSILHGRQKFIQGADIAQSIAAMRKEEIIPYKANKEHCTSTVCVCVCVGVCVCRSVCLSSRTCVCACTLQEFLEQCSSFNETPREGGLNKNPRMVPCQHQ